MMKIVALIGSMRFGEFFLKVEKELTFSNYLVLMPYIDGLTDKDSYSEEQWEYLMYHCLMRIQLADIVYVIDVEGYIGDHTKREIAFAEQLGKEIRYHNREELPEAPSPGAMVCPACRKPVKLEIHRHYECRNRECYCFVNPVQPTILSNKTCCLKCHGTGQIFYPPQPTDHDSTGYFVACNECDGTGLVEQK
jgi:hypothetical protein